MEALKRHRGAEEHCLSALALAACIYDCAFLLNVVVSQFKFCSVSPPSLIEHLFFRRMGNGAYWTDLNSEWFSMPVVSENKMMLLLTMPMSQSKQNKIIGGFSLLISNNLDTPSLVIKFACNTEVKKSYTKLQSSFIILIFRMVQIYRKDAEIKMLCRN